MKLADQKLTSAQGPRRKEAVILFSVANQQFVIAADSVQEIRSTDSLGGSASELLHTNIPKVRHMIERKRRTYYVVNVGVHFGLPVTRPLLVLILRGERVAALVDRIERMTEISRVYGLPQGFTGSERRWYRGLAYLDDRIIPVIQPSGFLTADELDHLDRLSHDVASVRQMQGVEV